MCGIVGMFSRAGEVSREALQAAVRRLNHRGPDENGEWISPHGDVGLGHARLSIIDLAGGKQPLSNEDESIHIVVNGEFYGHDIIRERLEKKGHRFRTRSDSEIAIHLYEEYGTGCLHHLRGEFAFAMWDARNRMLLAARDRF